LTSSLLGRVVKRRKIIHPKTIVNKITKLEIENEQKALVKHHEYKDEINEHVALNLLSLWFSGQSNVAMAWC
jgi:hypothetical protein